MNGNKQGESTFSVSSVLREAASAERHDVRNVEARVGADAVGLDSLIAPITFIIIGGYLLGIDVASVRKLDDGPAYCAALRRNTRRPELFAEGWQRGRSGAKEECKKVHLVRRG